MPSGTHEQTRPLDNNTFGPASVWLGLGILLTGLGTAILGPILPTLAHNWHITDQQSGHLIAAKFIGAFLGGLSVRGLLRRSILAGALCSFVGFAAFSFAHGLAAGMATLFVSGYGVGLSITALNILIGRRYITHTGAALSTLNFFWSLGATLCGFLAALLLPRYGLHGPVLIFAALFLLAAFGGWLLPSHRFGPTGATKGQESLPTIALPRLAHIHFAALLFFYGGLETCLTAWLTTYSLRYEETQLLGGQSAVVLLWGALTIGRVLSSAAMRFFSESAAQRVGLILSSTLLTAIITTRSSGWLSVYCLLLGLSLAPFFPSTFGILMRRRPHSQQAATIMAASGLGAAIFPWVMGYVSTHTGSLRIAMAVPAALVLLLLAMSFFPPDAENKATV
ncbi:MFS transporter [Granulicella paludicola]|uniref:MFS transporter n=1 Tax=Granulicella paludicola TaxID=474951 RepID=UPI0021DF81EC|nr:MFS transporter [Granulicella paludicola]